MVSDVLCKPSSPGSGSRPNFAEIRAVFFGSRTPMECIKAKKKAFQKFKHLVRILNITCRSRYRALDPNLA